MLTLLLLLSMAVPIPTREIAASLSVSMTARHRAVVQQILHQRLHLQDELVNRRTAQQVLMRKNTVTTTVMTTVTTTSTSRSGGDPDIISQTCASESSNFSIPEVLPLILSLLNNVYQIIFFLLCHVIQNRKKVRRSIVWGVLSDRYGNVFAGQRFAQDVVCRLEKRIVPFDV